MAVPDYLNLAVRYLARTDRTVAQVERYLRDKGATRPKAAAVVRELERLGYVNDQAYAVRWAETRLARRPMGRERLKAELLQRGFEEPVVERALKRPIARSPSRSWPARCSKDERAGPGRCSGCGCCGNAGSMMRPFSKSRKSI